MKMKTVLAALVLAIAPAIASAACWSGHTSAQTMSCGEGQVFDQETRSCVPVTTS